MAYKFTAKRRAAFKRMIAAGRRKRNPHKRRRRRNAEAPAAVKANPRRRRRSSASGRSRKPRILLLPMFGGGKTMSRKRRRKSNPRKRRHGRRRRNPGALLVNPRRRHHGRRRHRNPGTFQRSAKRGIGLVLKTALPSIAAGFVFGFIDGKFTAGKGPVVRTVVKILSAMVIGLGAGKIWGDVGAAVATGTILGTVGHEFGLRVAGGMPVMSKKEGVKELIAMAAEDEEVRAELGSLANEATYDGVNMAAFGGPTTLAEYAEMSDEEGY